MTMLFLTRKEQRRPTPKEDAEKPFWISYADLMTALMVLFLVALSAQLNEVSKQRSIADSQRDQAVGVQKELERERGRLEVLVAEIARRESERDNRRDQRNAQIERMLNEVEKAAQRQQGVHFDRVRGVIDFGGLALFKHGSHELTIEQANIIRQLVLTLLPIKRSEAGERWLKQIVAEGFADQTGAYLYNLNLSLQRSQRVLCVLLAEGGTQAPATTGAAGTTGATGPATAPAAGSGTAVPAAGAASPATSAVTLETHATESWKPLPPGWKPFMDARKRAKANMANPQAAPAPVARQQPALFSINAEDRALIKRLFIVGGYSSNSAKSSLDESRRIQLRIEFYQLDENVQKKDEMLPDTGRCALPG